MSRVAAVAAVAAMAAALVGCSRESRTTRGSAESEAPTNPQVAAEPAPNPAAPKPAARVPGCSLSPHPLRRPAAERVVAIGDVHGDLSRTRAVLRLAGAIDDSDRWVGGKLVVVQTGDVLDRGDDEPDIIDLFDRLAAEARAAGGAVVSLNGNHELMNAAGDFRYVTAGGFADFAGQTSRNPALAEVPTQMRGRAAAFLPGGDWALRLAERDTVAIVGDSLFVHGGVLPKYAGRLEELNLETRCWLSGASSEVPAAVVDSESPVWTRKYSTAPEACDELRRALKIAGVTRMVVGHTPNPDGITSACEGRVWRIDVGLARFYGGPIQALEIVGDDVRVLAQ